MKLDDFLKPKKVRCINRDNHGYLTENKVYDVIGATFGRLKIRNDYGDTVWYDMTCFELVIDSAENPPQFLSRLCGGELRFTVKAFLSVFLSRLCGGE